MELSLDSDEAQGDRLHPPLLQRRRRRGKPWSGDRAGTGALSEADREWVPTEEKIRKEIGAGGGEGKEESRRTRVRDTGRRGRARGLHQRLP